MGIQLLLRRCLATAVVIVLYLGHAGQSFAQFDTVPYGFGRIEPHFDFPSPAAQPTSRVRVLLVGDTNDPKIGDGVELDLANWDALFHELIPIPERLAISTLRGAEVDRHRILRTISSIYPGSDDALVFVWTGHGAYDERGHFFHMPDGGRLYRAEVVAAMRLRNPRLVVVLSGSCNERLEGDLGEGRYPPVSVFREYNGRLQDISAAAESLLLEPRGVVDINGASEGQLGYSHPARGCSFLSPLSDFLRRNAQRRVTWPELVEDVNPRVQQLVQTMLPDGYLCAANGKVYRTQTIRVWSLPEHRQGIRLGVAVAENGGDGVRVVEVRAETPATRLVSVATGQYFSLEPSDVILEINNQRVATEERFARALKISPRRMVLLVRDCRSGRVDKQVTTLLY